MSSRAASLLALLGAMAPMFACIETFETHDEFDHLPYLCAEENASLMQDRVEECRAARVEGIDCGGAIGIRGKLQGVDLEAASVIDRAIVHEVEVGDVAYLSRIDLGGSSAYFHFVVRLYGIGGVMPDEPAPAAPARSFEWTESSDIAVVTLEELQDEVASANIRFETDIESLAVGASSGSGGFDLTILGADELAGAFEARLDLDDSHLDGCFHAFVTGRRVGQLSP